MIDDLTDMMTERLLQYKQVSKALPERVIIFRDGVSEGQFNVVLKPDSELPAVKLAFDRVYGTAQKPRLTIVICGKRSVILSVNLALRLMGLVAIMHAWSLLLLILQQIMATPSPVLLLTRGSQTHSVLTSTFKLTWDCKVLDSYTFWPNDELIEFGRYCQVDALYGYLRREQSGT
jgi:hypothetical protein